MLADIVSLATAFGPGRFYDYLLQEYIVRLLFID